MKSFILFLSILFLSNAASAGIIVDVQDAQLTSGGTGFVDVLVRSDGPDTPIQLFSYLFEITNPVGNVGSLQFSDTQSIAETGDANYIFAGDSTAVPPGVTPTTILGDDATASFLDVNLTTADRLLVRLDVEHILPGGVDPTLAVGDQFSIVPDFSDPFSFFFEDGGFTGPTINQGLSSGGTVTFAFSTVPEPSSVLVLLGLTSMVGLRRRKK